jgi:hypothetical protein
MEDSVDLARRCARPSLEEIRIVADFRHPTVFDEADPRAETRYLHIATCRNFLIFIEPKLYSEPTAHIFFSALRAMVVSAAIIKLWSVRHGY